MQIKMNRFIPVFIGVILVSLLFFYGAYHFDNKYTFVCPQAKNGVLTLTEHETGNDFLLYLIDDWAFYQHQLLTPEDFKEKAYTPDKFVYIGEYSGFELDDKEASPYGNATYRMNILTGTVEEKAYMLELPEIYSAYKLWINGTRIYSIGQTGADGYLPQTANASVTFKATDRIDILFNVSNYSHYYSGMVYPPAFGTIKAVDTLLKGRLIFNAMLCFVTLTSAVFFFILGLWIKNKRITLLYTLVCLFFVGATCYPIILALHLPYMTFWYGAEDFCFFAMITVIGLLYAFITKTAKKWIVPFAVVGLMVLFSVIIFPNFLLKDNAAYLQAYSFFTDVYKFFVVCFLLVVVISAIIKNVMFSQTLLCGAGIFGVSLAVDAAVPLFEPIYLGWPTEIGSFAFVLLLGVVMILDTIKVYRDYFTFSLENAVLQQNAKMMEHQLTLQAEQYQMLNAYMDETEKNRHDLRHHLSVMQDYIESKDIEQLTAYITEYQNTAQKGKIKLYCRHRVINSVVNHYMNLASDVCADVEVKLEIPERMNVADTDLCIIFGNCLENAIEACGRQTSQDRFIRLKALMSARTLSIVIENSFDGQVNRNGDDFMSAKHKGEGIGISSVRAIVDKYSGHARFAVKEGYFETFILLNLPEYSNHTVLS